jgi:hypothetical protein
MSRNDGIKYWWIKLETDFFYKNAIDYLMSQKNGAEYVVLYQMLCLSTANSGGKFVSKVGEMVVKYDVEKIMRDTKYFDYDTIVVALELFDRLGLIYEEQDGVLKIANHEDMVGSRTLGAKRIEELRKKQKMIGTK